MFLDQTSYILTMVEYKNKSLQSINHYTFFIATNKKGYHEIEAKVKKTLYEHVLKTQNTYILHKISN